MPSIAIYGTQTANLARVALDVQPAPTAMPRDAQPNQAAGPGGIDGESDGKRHEQWRAAAPASPSSVDALSGFVATYGLHAAASAQNSSALPAAVEANASAGSPEPAAASGTSAAPVSGSSTDAAPLGGLHPVVHEPGSELFGFIANAWHEVLSKDSGDGPGLCAGLVGATDRSGMTEIACRADQYMGLASKL